MVTMRGVFYRTVLFLFAAHAGAQTIVTQKIQHEQLRTFIDSKRQYEQELEKNARNVEAHYRLGLAYLREPQNIEKAIEHLERAVKLDEHNAEYHFRLAEAYSADFSFTNIFRMPFIAAKVKAQLEAAVKYDPQSPVYRGGLIQYYTFAPAIMGGSFKKAHEQAEMIANTDVYLSMLAHAGIYAEEGEGEKAVELFRKAIRMRPKNWQAHQRFGAYYLTINQLDNAIVQFLKYVETAPDAADSYENLGRAYVRKRMYDEAIASYQKALEKNPTIVSLLFRIAQLYEFKGANKDAIRHYEKYVELVPTGPIADDARKKISDLSRN